MDASRRKELARSLLTHARLASAVIRGGRQLPSGSTLTAVAAAATMRELATDVLRELVDDARREGCTWAEIGETLGTSRQAAFQRFGP